MLKMRILDFLKIKKGETKIVFFSFLYFFSILASYYVLRPIRDEMAMELGSSELQGNFISVFLVMLGLVPLFGWLTKRFHRSYILPRIYAFFILNILCFYWVFEANGYQMAGIARIFFTWVSVFNLFVVSVFWSFMADLLKTEQSARLNGLISAGGTMGALLGPTLTASLIEPLGAKNLLLVSGFFLGVSIYCLNQLKIKKQFSRQTPEPEHDQRPIKEGQQDSSSKISGGSQSGFKGPVFAGLQEILRSPYLIGICLFMIFYSILSTFIYGISTELMPKVYTDPIARTKVLAQIDLAVNLVALGSQFFIFNKFIGRFGRIWGLLYLPLLSAVGFFLFGWSESLKVLILFGVLRRAGEFAISKPTRETLFNILPTEQKYRAKNVIDTLIHRTGDVLSIFIFGLFRSGEIVFIAGIGGLLSLAWIANSLWLGRRAEALLSNSNVVGLKEVDQR